MNDNIENVELSNNEITISDNRLIEFVHDLQDAIQNGKFQESNLNESNNKSHMQNFLNQSNVDNLSNQTFTYIVNWLKQQQLKFNILSSYEPKSNSHKKNSIDSSSITETKSDEEEMFDYLNEIKSLRSKLKERECENENLIQKINELQEENIDLKAKITNKKFQSYSQFNYENKDEIEKLKSVINELTRLNEEKDRKVDELTKQVIRFKRIQEIVLSAQTSNNLNTSSVASNLFNLQKNSSNLKNYDDLEIDHINESSLLTIKNDSERVKNGIMAFNNIDSLIDDQKCRQSTQITNGECLENSNQKLSAQQQIINSASLTSSISSSSSSGSSTSINPSQSCTNSNMQSIQAPLATISEFTSYSSSSTVTLTTPKGNRTSYEDYSQNGFERKDEIQSKSPKNKKKEHSSHTDSEIKINNNNNNNNQKNSHKSSKYSSAITLSSSHHNAKSVSPSPIKTSNQNKSIRQFFGKLIRTSLVNINDTNNFNNTININNNNKTNNNVSNFKRGGFRSTANARLQSNSNLDTLTFSKWPTNQVCEFLNKNGFESYFVQNSDGNFAHKWIKNGLHLLQATQYEYEKELGIKNPLHRKKLSLFLQSLINNTTSNQNNYQENQNINKLDQYWVLKWLDDIGLPQYKDVFNENMVDGRMLMHINNEDFHTLNINSELHYLSIKRAIHVLRLNNFDPDCLRRRPSGDDNLDKSEVMLWTNHRVMEWLRSIDLSEYAPNLRGSGVHGGLMVFESRFNSTVLADILSIPTSKTLLRRHLTTLFNDLIGTQMQELKKRAELQPGYQQLSASSKVKHVKKNNIAMGSLFSSAHKRTKSQDSRDFLSITPIIDFRQDLNKKDSNNIGLSATLPVNSSNYTNTEDLNSFKNKLSILTQENVPTSIV